MKIKALTLVLLLSLGVVPASGQAAGSYSRLLMSSPWCSLRPGPDGRRIRIVFHRDGHYVLASDRGNEGQWRVKGSTLYMGENGADPQAVGSEIRKLRNGRFILFVDGEEFGRCK